MIYGNGGEGRIAQVRPSGIGYRSGRWGDTNLVDDGSMSNPPILVAPTVFTRVLGKKEYELKDYLGNVRVVISDVKLNGDADGGGRRWARGAQAGQAPYMVDMRAYNNYYPGGMLQPERHWSIKDYRYKHQGQESDPEIYGEGNSYAYRHRMSDPRVIRFWSVDPLAPSYPGWSSYAFSQNRLIDGIELEGLEYFYAADGRLLGSIGDNRDVYSININTDNGETFEQWQSIVNGAGGNRTDLFGRAQNLGISHGDFTYSAGVLSREENNAEALRYLAHVTQNVADIENMTIGGLLGSNFSSVSDADKNALADTDNSQLARNSRAGLINALSGSPDPTGGAVLWDGADFLAWGDSGPWGIHAKLRNWGVEVPVDLYNQLLSANQATYPNGYRYRGVVYNFPDDVFTGFTNWQTITDPISGVKSRTNFRYEASNHPGRLLLRASAVRGNTIYWAPAVNNIEDYLYYR